MKKLLMTLLVAMLLSGMVIAVKKNASGSADRQATSELIKFSAVRELKKMFLAVLFDMHDPGGKVGGRARRKMRKLFKKNPMNSELRALAFLMAKQKETVGVKKG